MIYPANDMFHKIINTAPILSPVTLATTMFFDLNPILEFVVLVITIILGLIKLVEKVVQLRAKIKAKKKTKLKS